MTLYKFGRCLFFALVSILPGFSQSDLTLNHIGIEQGLPYHRIEGLMQDKQGFLWIATETGGNPV
ncbi:MAG: hypothetical protein IPL46_19150 [Saprospiraceae bacterium]|nr:hypothetical protein [Saprospiraceae bacterium]